MDKIELSCPPRTRPPLKTGLVTYRRPSRRKRRTYSPSDLSRVFRYVACEHGPKSALCAVLIESGKSEQIEEVIGELDALLDYLQSQSGNDDPFEYLVDLLIVLVASSKDILRLLKKQRFLRWVLKRLFLLKLMIDTMEKFAEMAEAVELLLGFIRKARPLLEACSCGPETTETGEK